MKNIESKYYGFHSCLALWKRRPDDVIRVYLAKSRVEELKPLLKWCAKNGKAYHIIPEEELVKVSDSVHHEGVCLLAKEPAKLSDEDFLKKVNEKCAILYLDGVENPHNLGSIVRTAAHFNFCYILGEAGKLPQLSPSAYRVAKGGAEFVRVVHLKSPRKTITALKKQGFSFISTSSHEGSSLFSFSFPLKSVIIMGSESFGVSPVLKAFTTHSVQIPGTGHVESLNVSVATALCLSEYARQHQGPK
jgi:RNA methyltransferase, TrmH family